MVKHLRVGMKSHSKEKQKTSYDNGLYEMINSKKVTAQWAYSCLHALEIKHTTKVG